MHETYLKADAAYKQALLDLEGVFGSPEAARKVLETNGVVTRIDAVVVALKRLRYELGFTSAQIVTFLSESVAARLEEDAFWGSLTRLRTELGFTSAQIATFLSGSVAARIQSDTFISLLKWLLDDVSVSVDKLASFGGSFFSTPESIIRETLTMLTGEYGVRPDDLPARNAFWSHVKQEGKLDELRAYLATCRTTGAVTARLAKLNGTAGLGRGTNGSPRTHTSIPFNAL